MKDSEAKPCREGNAAPISFIRGDGLSVAGFFLLALAVRIFYLIKVNPALGNDDERYIFIARSLAALDFQNAIHYHYPPFSSLLVLIFGWFSQNLQSAARAAAISMNALALIPLYLLALRIYGRRAAVLAAGFFAFRFFNFSASDLAEQVQLPVLYLALLSGFAALQSQKPAKFLLTGVLFGISFLTKPEAWAFFLLFLLIGASHPIWAWLKRAPAKAPRRFLAGIILAAAGYFFLAGPYLFSYYRDTGQFSLNPKARTLFLHHNLYHPQDLQYAIMQDRRGYYTLAQRILEGDRIPLRKSVAGVIWQNRKTFPRIYWNRFQANLSNYVAGFYLQRIAPWIWPLLLILGLWPRRSRQKTVPELYVHSFAMIPVFLVPLFTAAYPRFFSTMIPWFMIMLGRGAERALWLPELGLKKIPRPKLLSHLALAAPLAALGASALVSIARTPPETAYWSEVAYRRGVAEKLKQILPEGCRFMAELENQSLWYLAGFPPQTQVVLPIDPLPDIIFYAEQTRAKFLVFHPSAFQLVEQGQMVRRFSRLEPLLEPDFEEPGLKRIFRGQSPAGKIYVIYEIETVKCGK